MPKTNLTLFVFLLQFPHESPASFQSLPDDWNKSLFAPLSVFQTSWESRACGRSHHFWIGLADVVNIVGSLSRDDFDRRALFLGGNKFPVGGNKFRKRRCWNPSTCTGIHCRFIAKSLTLLNMRATSFYGSSGYAHMPLGNLREETLSSANFLCGAPAHLAIVILENVLKHVRIFLFWNAWAGDRSASQRTQRHTGQIAVFFSGVFSFFQPLLFVSVHFSGDSVCVDIIYTDFLDYYL